MLKNPSPSVYDVHFPIVLWVNYLTVIQSFKNSSTAGTKTGSFLLSMCMHIIIHMTYLVQISCMNAWESLLKQKFSHLSRSLKRSMIFHFSFCFPDNVRLPVTMNFQFACIKSATRSSHDEPLSPLTMEFLFLLTKKSEVMVGSNFKVWRRGFTKISQS